MACALLNGIFSLLAKETLRISRVLIRKKRKISQILL